MANARIEEVSDDDDLADDPEEMDLDAFDFARPQQTGGSLQTSAPNASASAGDSNNSQFTPEALQSFLQSQGMGGQQQPFSNADRERLQREQHEKSRMFQAIYPIYFDSARSREQGRRVSKEDAVANPLARGIADALQYIGNSMAVPLQVVLEPVKTHPKDWANPGRVKVLIKENGKPVSTKIKNKHHLYKLISAYLKTHPTTEDSPLRLRIQGMPMPKDNQIIPPAIPRGSKIGSILPLHSPALSGGGVSDNFLKDMMSEMGGQLPPGMANMAGMMGGGAAHDSPGSNTGSGGARKVKDKKKK